MAKKAKQLRAALEKSKAIKAYSVEEVVALPASLSFWKLPGISCTLVILNLASWWSYDAGTPAQRHRDYSGKRSPLGILATSFKKSHVFVGHLDWWSLPTHARRNSSAGVLLDETWSHPQQSPTFTIAPHSWQ